MIKFDTVTHIEKARRTWCRNFSKRTQISQTPTHANMVWHMNIQISEGDHEVWGNFLQSPPCSPTLWAGLGQNIMIILRTGMFILLAAILLTILLTYSVVWHSCYFGSIGVSPAPTQFWGRPSIIRVPQFCGESPVFCCPRNKLGAPWKILFRRKDTFSTSSDIKCWFCVGPTCFAVVCMFCSVIWCKKRLYSCHSSLIVTKFLKTTKFMSNVLEAISKLKLKNSKTHFSNLVLYLPAYS